jgi:hypothetical protein
MLQASKNALEAEMAAMRDDAMTVASLPAPPSAGEAAATDTPEKKGKWGDRVKAMKAKAEAARAKIAK